MNEEVNLLVRDLDCERLLCSSVIGRRGAFHNVREFVREDSFYDEFCKNIWKATTNVADKGDDIDLISVRAELLSMGVKFNDSDYFDLVEGYSTSDLQTYALRLRDLAVRRKMWEVGTKLVRSGVDESVDIEEMLHSARESIDGVYGEGQKGISTIADAISLMYEGIRINMTEGGYITGSATGFRRFDDKGGFQPSWLIVIAGETSQGKTSFALSIVKNAIERGERVAYYSLEMTNRELAARLTAMKSGVKSSDILYRHDMNRHELESIRIATDQLRDKHLFFDDRSTSNIETIITSIRSMKIKMDIKGAVVDYLQVLNVNSKDSNKEKVMGEVSRRLKNLAKELDIWIIGISQLNRDRTDPVPNLGRLRDSGQIAEAADLVVLVHRPEYYGRSFPKPFENVDTKGMAMIDVAKGRNVGVFKFVCKFNSELTLFSDVDDSNIPQAVHIEDDAPF